MKTFILIGFVLIFSGCSFKTEQKEMWKQNASSSFDSYANYYLKGEMELASVSLQRAISSAKNSVDLIPLSKIYLGTCALHVAVLKEDKCLEYSSIREMLSEEDTSEDYYNMLQKNFHEVKVENLPLQYIDFVKEIKKEEYKSAFHSIKNMSKISSKLVAAALMREHLNEKEINYIIEEASLSGYKKAVIGWLQFLKEKSDDAEKQKIQKMLDILLN
jgi:uncharacterized protein YfeS